MRFSRTVRWGWRAQGALVLATLGAATSGCGSDQDEGGASGSACVSTREYFAQKAWPEVLAKSCLTCHSPDGLAAEKNAKFKLLPPSYPGFIDANLENLAFVAGIEFEGKSELLRKPLGEMSHGGEVVLDASSPEYKTLTELVKRLQAGDACPAPTGVPQLDDVELLDPAATLRKASLHLVSRLPTPAELDAVAAGGEGALPGLLMALMAEPAFLVRVKEMFNDALLTDQFLSYSGYAANLLNDEDFPLSAPAAWDPQAEDVKVKTNRALAREPLELIAHVVAENRPFTEILTAPYTVVNPFSAPLLNVTGVTFANPTDETEFHEAALTVQRAGQAIPIPHAGVLTSFMYLNRHTTTPTNRNRHRAWHVMKTFLATDILQVANRPLDPLAATAYQNPTREDASCAACHRQIDPIAGSFQKWDDYDQEKYQPDKVWHDEMFPPGFGEETMQTSDYAAAPQWLAQRITRDRRFSLAMTRIAFQALVGRSALSYPSDTASADYGHALKSWEIEDATFRAISEGFVDANYDFKALVRDVVLSPYFRARNLKGEPSAARAVELAGIGTGHLLSPELLSRKIAAVAGVPWTRSWDRESWLTTDFRILYGGIDSENVTVRLAEPNGVMAGVMTRMANEVACSGTSWDFSKPAADRLLFPLVTLEQVPETSAGDPVPAAVDAIKQNLVHLHAYLLGETLSPGDPEIERSYRLFYDTWKEGQQKLASGELDDGITWDCRARTDRATGEDLPAERQINDDPSYALRSWMAVTSYLLSDFSFLYE